MSTPYLGELRLLSFSFAPRGWAFCQGQLLPINQNQALFSILGTTYGGDGRVNFALPDLRGRQVLHTGGGFAVGERGGAETVTLTAQQAVEALAANGNQDTNRGASGSVLARGGSYSTDPATTTLGAVGGGQAHTNMPPYLVLSWAIALQGIFPSRN